MVHRLKSLFEKTSVLHLNINTHENLDYHRPGFGSFYFLWWT